MCVRACACVCVQLRHRNVSRNHGIHNTGKSTGHIKRFKYWAFAVTWSSKSVQKSHLFSVDSFEVIVSRCKKEKEKRDKVRGLAGILSQEQASCSPRLTFKLFCLSSECVSHARIALPCHIAMHGE